MQLAHMMDYPLVVPRILDRATRVFGHKPVVGRRADGTVERSTYSAIGARVQRLMAALRSLGVRAGDKVATLAVNHIRHLEAYFAVPSLGAVLHTVNLRLADDQVCYILDHGGAEVVLVDAALAPRIAALRASLPRVRHFIVIDDASSPRSPAANSPLSPCHDYESLLGNATPLTVWPDLDERMPAGLCYTSGTTGEPKGVAYTHRSFFLHAMGVGMVDSLAVGEAEVVLPIVPMFHVNAWGCPYAAALTGATQVFPGSHLQGKPLVELIAHESVTIAAGVPTVWSLVLQHLKKDPTPLPSLHTVVVGGSAAPRAMVEAFDALGIDLVHAWGMTETSPVGTVSRLPSGTRSATAEERMRQRLRQGTPVPGVEIKAIDEQGVELPHDGEAAGELCVRGPWITASYLGNPAASAAAFTADGWFKTGDVVTIDRHGSMAIVDRTKDLIKTRGEWVSSVAMENALVGFAGVLEAAVVARVDAMRGEAPVVFVVRDPAAPPVTKQAILDHLGRSFEHWQLPKLADVLFADAIPKTSVGKIDKKVLRARLRD